MSNNHHPGPNTPSPVHLSPPGNNKAELRSEKSTSTVILVSIIFLLLVIIAGLVFFLLPGKITDAPLETKNSVSQDISTDNQSKDQTLKVNDEAKRASQIDRLTQAVELFLSLKAEAEAANTGVWAPSKYKQILKAIVFADQLFEEQKYQDALSAYETSAEDLKELLATKDSVLARSLADGNSALADGESTEALQNFARALAIAPGNPEAQQGMNQAGTLKRVWSLFEEAQEYVKREDYQQAEVVLKQIIQVDADFSPAATTLLQVQNLILENTLKEKLGHFYSSLGSQDLHTAKNILSTLNSTFKDHPEILKAQDVLIRAEEKKLLEDLRRKGEFLSGQERWDEAAAMYSEALKIAPQALFAVNGHNQATNRDNLDKSIISILENPSQLQDPVALETASDVLKFAQGISTPGPKLSRQTEELSKALQIAATPLTVMLDSDGQTEITIYHVGNLGRFHTREISLRPGEYTVVGIRLGFRDVRTTIEVNPYNQVNRFSIACKDPI